MSRHGKGGFIDPVLGPYGHATGDLQKYRNFGLMIMSAGPSTHFLRLIHTQNLYLICLMPLF